MVYVHLNVFYQISEFVGFHKIPQLYRLKVAVMIFWLTLLKNLRYIQNMHLAISLVFFRHRSILSTFCEKKRLVSCRRLYLS
jgi:hypothetical protein